ncbi:MAG: hypothetical protein CL694_04010 [Chloroflexi bacterium]|nr:hypothetical protein [Chloroflexota bacterium]
MCSAQPAEQNLGNPPGVLVSATAIVRVPDGFGPLGAEGAAEVVGARVGAATGADVDGAGADAAGATCATGAGAAGAAGCGAAGAAASSAEQASANMGAKATVSPINSFMLASLDHIGLNLLVSL